MDSTIGSLTIIDANTVSPKVYWKGQLVEGITSIKVTNDTAAHKVSLVIQTNQALAEMVSAGIEIKLGGV